MTANVEDLAAQVHRQAVEAAVHRSAAGLGIEPGALLDSRSFWGATQKLDPGAADFGQRVQAAMQETAESDPARFAVPSAATGAGPGAAASEQWTEEDAERATPEEIMAAIDAGLLADLGCPPPRHRRGSQ
jgi:hypothetical protein